MKFYFVRFSFGQNLFPCQNWIDLFKNFTVMVACSFNMTKKYQKQTLKSLLKLKDKLILSNHLMPEWY